MTKAGLEAALGYGKSLKEFNNDSEAEKYFFDYKKRMIKEFEQICSRTEVFEADYTVDSLKTLERWYFDIWETNDFASFEVSREVFEIMMALYFDETVVKNIDEAKWTVVEYPFIKGKYELAIKCGLMTMAGTGHFKNLCTMQGNKKRNFLLREYKKYFG